MASVVIDYMSQPCDPAALAAMQIGVAVYIAPQSWNWPKAVKAAQLQALDAAGVESLLNFETNEHQQDGGMPAGIQHGDVVQQALNELGADPARPVNFSADRPYTVSDYGTVAAYMTGVKSVLGARPLSWYGQGELGEYLYARGLIEYIWQSESTSFPGNAQPTMHTCLRQVYGQTIPGLCGSYDVNHVLQADWGQWPRPASDSPKPPPPPEPIAMQYFAQDDQGHGAAVDAKGNILLHGGKTALKKDDGTLYATTTDAAFYGGVTCIKENPDNPANGWFYVYAMPIPGGFAKNYVDGKGNYHPQVDYLFV